MRNRTCLLASMAAILIAASPAEAKKKKDLPPPVPVRPAPILALSSANAPTVNFFYERRQEAPVWFTQAGGTAATSALIALLRQAPIDGMPTGPQVAAQVEAYVLRAQGGDALAVKTAERALTNAWVDYVQALQRPNTNVVWGDPALTLKPGHPDRIMAILSSTPSIAAHIQSVSAVNPIYAKLRETALAEAAANGGTASSKVLLNLERARILPGTGKFILVNTAEQRLHMYEGSTNVGSMKVVVGSKAKFGLPTPIIASTMNYGIANPYWHVPEHLVAKWLPSIVKQKDAYLKARNYEIISDFSEHPRILSTSEVDWDAVSSGRTKLLLRQKPGGSNSMGKMKFPFPNSEGIYLHDTPTRNYFAESNRALSNGCVRVEDYRALARWVFGKDPVVVGNAPEQPMVLPRGIPVYVTYLTMVPTATGMATFEDRYNWDHPGALAGGREVVGGSPLAVAASPSAN